MENELTNLEILSNLKIKELKKVSKLLKIKGYHKITSKNKDNAIVNILRKPKKQLNKILVELNFKKKQKNQLHLFLLKIPAYAWALLSLTVVLLIFFIGREERRFQRELNIKTSVFYDRLAQKYPYGFKVFGVLDNDKVLFGKEKIKPNMLIQANWNELEAKVKSDSIVSIKMPEFSYRTKQRVNQGGKISIDGYNVTTTFKMKNTGEETPITGVSDSKNPIMPLCEITDYIDDNPVFTIGLRKLSNSDIAKYEKDTSILHYYESIKDNDVESILKLE